MRLPIKPDHRQELNLLYTEPHRAYHTLEHITIMFNLATAHGVKLSVPQQLAIWYHDCIYDPTRKDNEEQSNRLFLRHHDNVLHPNYITRTSNIILDTISHISDNHESFDVLDLDLAGFGFDTNSYHYATSQIRLEFSHLSEEEWRYNRKQFLTSLLNRKHIFQTHWARDFYEIKARRNIEADIKSL